MKRSRETEEFSHSTDQEQQTLPKITQLDSALSNAEYSDSEAPIMRCFLPPHVEPVSFRSYHDYEAHYARDHSYRCMECHKNFPSEHLLNVHIEECHDSIVAVKRERGEKTYSCFVESCERKCSTPQKRRLHLIDKHLYPKNFFFAVTRDGIDGRRSLLSEGGHHSHPRKPSAAGPTKSSAAKHAGQSSSQDTAPSSGHANSGADPAVKEASTATANAAADANAPQNPDTEMEDLSNAMSSLLFVPRGIRFGRGGRAGFAKR